MKVLITGATGLYGSKLTQMCIERGFEVYSCGIQQVSAFDNCVKMNISDKPMVDKVFLNVNPDVVVHAAALTDVDKCETKKQLAWKINVEGTKNIVDASKKHGSFLVYISTDYVFNGTQGLYKETDTPEPINYYGETKLEAENLVETNLTDYCIERPSVIYGSRPATGNMNFVLWLIDELKEHKRLKIVDDQWNTPTLNTNLSEMTLEIVDRRLTGIFHLCGATRVNRLDFAKAIAKMFDLDLDLIDVVKSSDFTWSAKRPMDSSLDTTKAQHQLKHKPLELYSALNLLKRELTLEKG